MVNRKGRTFRMPRARIEALRPDATESIAIGEKVQQVSGGRPGGWGPGVGNIDPGAFRPSSPVGNRSQVQFALRLTDDGLERDPFLIGRDARQAHLVAPLRGERKFLPGLKISYQKAAGGSWLILVVDRLFFVSRPVVQRTVAISTYLSGISTLRRHLPKRE